MEGNVFVKGRKGYFLDATYLEVREALEEAYSDVAGNVNGKVVFVDLSLKVNRLLHISASVD